MKLGLQHFTGLLPEGQFDEVTCGTAFRACKTFRFDACGTVGGDDDFDRLLCCVVAYVVIHIFPSDLNWELIRVHHIMRL